MNHSPEPWEIQPAPFHNIHVVDVDGRDVAVEGYRIIREGSGDIEVDVADVERYVACVNALADIEDPEAFVRAVKEWYWQHVYGSGEVNEALDHLAAATPVNWSDDWLGDSDA